MIISILGTRVSKALFVKTPSDRPEILSLEGVDHDLELVNDVAMSIELLKRSTPAIDRFVRQR